VERAGKLTLQMLDSKHWDLASWKWPLMWFHKQSPSRPPLDAEMVQFRNVDLTNSLHSCNSKEWLIHLDFLKQVIIHQLRIEGSWVDSVEQPPIGVWSPSSRSSASMRWLDCRLRKPRRCHLDSRRRTPRLGRRWRRSREIERLIRMDPRLWRCFHNWQLRDDSKTYSFNIDRKRKSKHVTIKAIQTSIYAHSALQHWRDANRTNKHWYNV